MVNILIGIIPWKVYTYVIVAPAVSVATTVRLWLPEEYSKKFKIIGKLPAPVNQDSGTIPLHIPLGCVSLTILRRFSII